MKIFLKILVGVAAFSIIAPCSNQKQVIAVKKKSSIDHLALMATAQKLFIGRMIMC
jgi:hypothetical protein